MEALDRALKDVIESKLAMSFFADHARAAYAEIGGAFMGKASIKAFELAYMRRVFAA